MRTYEIEVRVQEIVQHRKHEKPMEISLMHENIRIRTAFMTEKSIIMLRAFLLVIQTKYGAKL